MRLKALVAFALLVVVFMTGTSAQTPDGGSNNAIAGEILVKFRPGTTGSAKADAHRQGGGTRLASIARTGVERVRVTAGAESAAIGRYGRNPNVLYELGIAHTLAKPVLILS